MRKLRPGVALIASLLSSLMLFTVCSFKGAAIARKALPLSLRPCALTAKSATLPLCSWAGARAPGMSARWRSVLTVSANAASTSAKDASGALSTDTPPSTMTSEEFRPFRVASIQQVSHNTRLIDVALSDRNEWPGFVTSCLVMVRLNAPFPLNTHVVYVVYADILKHSCGANLRMEAWLHARTRPCLGATSAAHSAFWSSRIPRAWCPSMWGHSMSATWWKSRDRSLN
jgi:hypothetical protein